MPWSLFGADELLREGEVPRLRSILERSGVPLPSFEPSIYRFLLTHRLIEPKSLAQALAGLRVKSLSERMEPDSQDTPFPAEVAFEERFLLKPQEKPYGIPYEANLLQRKLRPLLAQAGLSRLLSPPIILLPDLLATFDTSDKRYHLRMNVLGHPSLVSIPGIVLAPAKPRPYYLMKQAGIDPAYLETAFKEAFIGHKDPRTPRIISGLILQALFYTRTGEAFCQNAFCSLFNAHWHHELIAIYGTEEGQAKDPNPLPLCQKHKDQLRGIDLNP